MSTGGSVGISAERSWPSELTIAVGSLSKPRTSGVVELSQSGEVIEELEVGSHVVRVGKEAGGSLGSDKCGALVVQIESVKRGNVHGLVPRDDAYMYVRPKAQFDDVVELVSHDGRAAEGPAQHALGVHSDELVTCVFEQFRSCQSSVHSLLYLVRCKVATRGKHRAGVHLGLQETCEENWLECRDPDRGGFDSPDSTLHVTSAPHDQSSWSRRILTQVRDKLLKLINVFLRGMIGPGQGSHVPQRWDELPRLIPGYRGLGDPSPAGSLGLRQAGAISGAPKSTQDG